MRSLGAVLKREDGNTALLLMGLISIMMILFVFVFNLAKVFAVKEMANTTAQQASLAATAALYEDIEGILPGEILIKVGQREISLRGSMSGYSNNEIHIQAINEIIMDELNIEPGGVILTELLEEHINVYTYERMKQAAREAIIDNNGSLEGAKIQIKSNRVYVKASNSVKASSYGKYFKDVSKKLYQKSAGPTIDFLSAMAIHSGEESLE